MNKKFWDIYALSYDTATLNFSAYKDLINSVKKELNLSSNQSVLNAGCGTGNLERSLLDEDLAFDWKGIDISDSMLKRAEKKTNGDNRFKFEPADLNYSLEVESGSINTVISIHSLYPLKVPAKAVAEFSRVLKNGGRLILVNPKKDANMSKMIKYEMRKRNIFKFMYIFLKAFPAMIINLIISKLAKNSSYHFLTKTEIMSMLEDVGFEILSLNYVYVDQSFLITAIKP